MEQNHKKYEEIVSRLEKKTGYDRLSVWNDIPGRTKEEVIQLFKDLDL